MNKPNIIFILMDDMGWVDLSCMGSKFYETPNIDSLARDGMMFTDAYASCPVCSPTRASLMTGKYPARVGITHYIGGSGRGYLADVPYIRELRHSEKTIASALKEGGYSTWHIGKWHLGTEPYYPETHGFDVNVGGCHYGHPKYGYFSPWNIPTLENGPKGEYLTDRITDEAMKLIDNHKGSPFFLNLCYYSVHTPIQAKEEKIAKYRAKAEAMGIDTIPAFEDGDFFPSEHKKDQRIRRRLLQSDPAYAAMIESLDDNIGRIFELLERKNIANNTIVIFTSDNGGLATAEGSPTCNAPLSEGKGWMYEGGTREPMLVRWPGKVQPGSICDVPVTTPDFYPTFLEAAGLDLIPEQHVDGVSLLPLFEGGDELEREAIFWHYPHYGNQGGTPGCSVRKGRYKLIEFFEDWHCELYDLKKDISEEHDLAADLPNVVNELRALLENWREDVKAKIPEKNPDFVPWREGHKKLMTQS